MNLKNYQSETLGTLRRYLESARIAGPKAAYEAIVKEPKQLARLGRYGGDYTPLEGLPGVPYVCLRLPTGGGKTILGTHAIGVARDAWIEKEFPLVLWLVPSNTIRTQTAEALKNPAHPYRQVLDSMFDGRVRIFDITDFSDLRPHDIRDNCCVVVGTIQTLRVQNTEGRKVYAHHEELEPHFSGAPIADPELEKLDDGSGIKFSFANLLHIHRPLMIVDEAHGAVTGLTREMQVRVNPCAIVEFTATPRLNSNILHSVTAQELKNEEMIKLPIVLSEQPTWQNAVNGAIAQRAQLAKEAEGDSDYIRPIVLFQAQDKNQEVTVAVLKQYLIDVENIDADKIAVATGDQRDLDGIDLFDRGCKIEYVITVEALKEGWDCSFAYVFCSVSKIQSATDAEQLLGRVLRMPYAKRRKPAALNKAYAFLSEVEFGKSARGLADKLVAMGFDETEATSNIEPVQQELGRDILVPAIKPPPVLTQQVKCDAEAIKPLENVKGIEVVETTNGEFEIKMTGPISPEVEEKVANVLTSAERPSFKKQVAEHRARFEAEASPAQKGESFRVPRLFSGFQGVLELADTDIFMESHEWSLLKHAASLSQGEFAISETASEFVIDFNGQKVTYDFAGDQAQQVLDIDVQGWTPEALTLWLDRQVRRPDIEQSQLIRWLSDLVQNLTTARGIPIASLMRCKFILARKVREKLAGIRESERGSAYQQRLFAAEAKVEVSFDDGFEFKDGMYSDQRRYIGSWKPRCHFLGADQLPGFDGAADGEEFQCAQALDAVDGVKFWVRNVARHPSSFWLPTAADKFYPDFVAQLTDGRLLVVEYKGAHLADGADTAEKRTIGELWERKSGGKGLFLVVEKTVGGKDMRAQISGKIGG